MCSRDINISYSDAKDFRKHEHTGVHQSMNKSHLGTAPLTSYFGSTRGPNRETSIEAKIKFVFFLAKHHIPFTVSDHCAKLFASMFRDSAIAKSFNCGRKKATAVIEVVAQEIKKGILSQLQESQFFSIQLIDETTDITIDQQCGVMLRFFDNVEVKMRCIFHDLMILKSANADGVFQCLDKIFSDDSPIKYSKLVGFLDVISL